MTKITIKAESISTADLFVKALIVLPESAVIAFHAAEGTLYVNDNYKDAALAYLQHAGISAAIVESGQS